MDERKRQIRDEFRAKERARVRESMPIGDEQAQALFDRLDAALGDAECDHTLRLTMAWASEQRVDAAKLRPWLEGLGGFCDCEVLNNVEERWKDSLRGTDRERP